MQGSLFHFGGYSFIWGNSNDSQWQDNQETIYITWINQKIWNFPSVWKQNIFQSPYWTLDKHRAQGWADWILLLRNKLFWSIMRMCNDLNFVTSVNPSWINFVLNFHGHTRKTCPQKIIKWYKRRCITDIMSNKTNPRSTRRS